MGKAAIKLESSATKGYSLAKIKKMLGGNNECYVLITCGSPSSDGKIEVEMSYEGDEVLAAFLVESAQQVFEHNQGKQTKPQ